MYSYYLSSRKNLTVTSLGIRKKEGGDLFSIIIQDLSLVRIWLIRRLIKKFKEGLYEYVEI